MICPLHSLDNTSGGRDEPLWKWEGDENEGGGRGGLWEQWASTGGEVKQTLTLPDGRPKGAALVLQERGYDTTRMKLEEMRRILAEHDDFKNEKCRVDTFLSSCGHRCVFIPKFHCELNPIVCVWSQSKRYTRAHTDYTIASLRRSIPEGLKSVSKENIANYVRRCRNYMFVYLEGSAVGGELEERIKFYKSVNYTSHRRVGMND